MPRRQHSSRLDLTNVLDLEAFGTVPSVRRLRHNTLILRLVTSLDNSVDNSWDNS
jgi:hypothetical protein